MRPIRLEMEGFSSFRERTVVDFADAELFAFSGPTGAGKSSIIDAMVFALYGSVPRYGDDRLVGSAVNQQSSRALVDFEFAVGDERYRVVREVRRQARGGGSTREARLERAGSAEPLFDGDARQLTGEVERLLGLTRDQFTKCVVLPQGDFQRFLHDKPRVRQDLLVQLLGVEVYSRVGELARQRQRAAAAQVEALDRQRQELEQVVADEPRLRDRLAALGELQRVIDEVGPGLDEAEAALAAARSDLHRLDGELTRLGRVRRPDDLEDLAEAVAELDEELASLKADETRRSAAEAEAEAALAALPHPRARLEEARAWHERRADLDERIAKGERMVAEVAEQLQAAQTALTAADEQLAGAEQALEAARVEHAAAHLASGLAAGDRCPVCHRTIDEVPRHGAADLEAADSARASALATRDRARAERDELAARHQSFAATLAARREELDGLGAAPVDAPADQIAAHLAEVAVAEQQVEAARLARRSATERREASERKRGKIAKLETGAWNEFDRVRDEVAALGPPPAQRDDLGGSWAALQEWAEQQQAERAQRRASVVDALGEIERKRQAAVDALDQAFVAAGLERRADGWREDVAAEAARTTEKLEQVERAKEAAAARTAERDQAHADEQVAGEVGNLMKANAFEKWLLDEALEALVVGGSAKLDALSRGQYSLAVDGRGGFLVVDHHNAGEARSARTLSGGETFLASLALALALAEQVADLASQGAPRIDSIFLDEGFGSLDPDTLEVVVAAIEELHASGLVVGLVSHVPELAERVPTRFEVAKGLEGSTVERIDR